MFRFLIYLFRNYCNKFVFFRSERHSTQELLFYYSLYITFLLTSISFVSNIILGLPLVVDVFAATGAILSIFLFWVAFHRRKYLLALHIFLIFLIVSLNALWLFSEGSSGSTLIIFQGFLLLVLFYAPAKTVKITIPTAFVNVLILFAIEIYWPDLIVKYDSPMQKTLDILVVTLIFFLLMLPVIMFANRAIVRERNQALESEAAKTSFFLSLSHEIRTPMNAILGFSELLEDDELTKEQHKHYLSIINQNGRALLNLLNNVISFSKLEANQSTIAISPINANQLVEQVYYSLQQMIDKDKNIDFRMHCPNPTPTIATDVLKIYQILLNIAFNALKFTENGFVEVGYKHNHHWVEFYVKDTGCGIPPDAQHDIFDRFKQAGQTLKSSTQHGAGLGLAICKRLSLLIDAQITLESEVGKGSTFFVKVPMKIAGAK